MCRYLFSIYTIKQNKEKINGNRFKILKITKMILYKDLKAIYNAYIEKERTF